MLSGLVWLSCLENLFSQSESLFLDSVQRQLSSAVGCTRADLPPATKPMNFNEMTTSGSGPCDQLWQTGLPGAEHRSIAPAIPDGLCSACCLAGLTGFADLGLVAPLSIDRLSCWLFQAASHVRESRCKRLRRPPPWHVLHGWPRRRRWRPLLGCHSGIIRSR